MDNEEEDRCGSHLVLWKGFKTLRSVQGFIWFFEQLEYMRKLGIYGFFCTSKLLNQMAETMAATSYGLTR